MQAEVIFSVMDKLGVLFRAPGVDVDDPGAPVPADAEHVFYEHTPLWEYEPPYYALPFADPNAKPLFRTLPPGTSVSGALEHTKLLVFLGAANTQALQRALAAPGCLVLVFDQDPGRMARLAQAVGPAKLAGRAYLFLGALETFLPPLSMVLPATLFKAGFPVFFTLPDYAALRPDSAEAVSRQLEVLFFQHLVYPLGGQANVRGMPLRPMQRGLFYDQQLHAFANIAAMAQDPDIGLLKRTFKGETALLVAAGPDLPKRLEYLKRHCGNALVIAVNNALKPLLAAGLRPHFVVANDTSTLTARSWEGLPRLADVTLVAHCLTDLGGEVFPSRFLFGTYWPELLGTRPNLRLHGSVITTAFSLARHLGCARCVLVGVQLCSDNPWAMSYSRGTIHEDHAVPPGQLSNAWPQLAPVTNRFGLTLYTTLNFLDASLWLLDEIRFSGLPCVNLTRHSLVHGPGVDYDPDFAPEPTGNLARRLRQVRALAPRPRPLGPTLKTLGVELEGWKNIAGVCAQLAQASGEPLLTSGMQLLSQFEQNNISYLVQRFEDFDNRRFHAAVFDAPSGPEGQAGRQEGLRYYFGYVRRMAEEFAQVLAGQLELLNRLARQG